MKSVICCDKVRAPAQLFAMVGDDQEVPVIINELLCYVSNKISTMTSDDILCLCLKFFDDEEISSARGFVLELCKNAKVPKMDRYKKRKGAHKTRSNLEDVISMMHDLGTNVPTFVAKDIHKLPPVSFDSIDVSGFLHKIEKLDANFTGIKEALDEYTAKKNSELNVLAAAIKEPHQGAPVGDRPERPRLFMDNPETNNSSAKGLYSAKVKSSNTLSKAPVQKPPLKNEARIQNLKRATGGVSGIAMQADNEERTREHLVADRDHADENNWILVEKKRRKVGARTGQTAIRRGTNKGEHAQKVKPVLREISLFSSKWPVYVEVADVVAYFKDAHDLVAKVSPIITRADSYKCFKIILYMTDPSIAYEPEFWPERVAFRRYYYRAADRNVGDKGNMNRVGKEVLSSGLNGVNNLLTDNNGQECNRDGKDCGTNPDFNNDTYESCTDDEEVQPLSKVTKEINDE